MLVVSVVSVTSWLGLILSLRSSFLSVAYSDAGPSGARAVLAPPSMVRHLSAGQAQGQGGAQGGNRSPHPTQQHGGSHPGTPQPQQHSSQLPSLQAQGEHSLSLTLSLSLSLSLDICLFSLYFIFLFIHVSLFSLFSLYSLCISIPLYQLSLSISLSPFYFPP